MAHTWTSSPLSVPTHAILNPYFPPHHCVLNSGRDPCWTKGQASRQNSAPNSAKDSLIDQRSHQSHQRYTPQRPETKGQNTLLTKTNSEISTKAYSNPKLRCLTTSVRTKQWQPEQCGITRVQLSHCSKP